MKFLLLIILCCGQIVLSQQKKNIGGRITDDLGSPISGASVIEKSNPENGTLTDFEGFYTLQLDESSKELEISSAGFKSKVVPIEGSIVNITLEQNENELKEVTIKGFGSLASRARVRL